MFINTGASGDSIAVGSETYIDAGGVSQYGTPMAVESMETRLSDSAFASRVLTPGSPWDYGDPIGGTLVLLGGVPGRFVYTVTGTLHGVSHSAQRTITIVPSNSGMSTTMQNSAAAWYYAPHKVVVNRAGGAATMTWRVLDGGTHSVHWDLQPAGATVANIEATTNQDVVRGFSIPGTYVFHCEVHPEMSGTIIVQ